MRGIEWQLIGIILAGLVACGGSSSPDSTLEFGHFEVDRLTTRLSEGAIEKAFDPERAFLIRSVCPKIKKAHYFPESSGAMGVLQVWGESMEASWGLVAWPEAGPIGRAQAKIQPDGSQRFAVGCRDCSLLFGMESEGEPFACIGPGHSLRLKKGRLVRED